MAATVRMADLSWVDYAKRIAEDSPVLFLPVGAIEQHGHHLPMDCDVVIPDELSVRAAACVDGLVAPPIAYGYKSCRASEAATISRARLASTARPSSASPAI